MKKYIFMKQSSRFLVFFLVSLSVVFSQVKLAQTGAQFLSVDSDARAGGMGGALTTVEMNSASLFFNPAGMARMNAKIDAMASQNQWIADIAYNSFSFAFNPNQGAWGVFAASLVSVDYGDIQGTQRWNNEPGYIDTEILTPSAYAMGFGYAKALSDKFAVGAHVKYVGLNYGKSVYPAEDDNATPDTVKSHLAFSSAFDFGTIYRTGWNSLAFGMSVRNFSNEVTFESEGFQLPLTFTLGISMDVFDLKREMLGNQKLLVSIDALHYRSHAEQIRVGLEYKPIEMVAFRTGYMSSNDENDISFGVGVKAIGLMFDYAYEPFAHFDAVQRMTVRFSI
ncbi:MAG: PorV/PorQ family protein [Candidatus Marinimicrobia bacterium]|nr:PorV/PorQ family protein [Candidatus Neomarinimicrobiota bacterium]